MSSVVLSGKTPSETGRPLFGSQYPDFFKNRVRSQPLDPNWNLGDRTRAGWIYGGGNKTVSASASHVHGEPLFPKMKLKENIIVSFKPEEERIVELESLIRNQIWEAEAEAFIRKGQSERDGLPPLNSIGLM